LQCAHFAASSGHFWHKPHACKQAEPLAEIKFAAVSALRKCPCVHWGPEAAACPRSAACSLQEILRALTRRMHAAVTQPSAALPLDRPGADASETLQLLLLVLSTCSGYKIMPEPFHMAAFMASIQVGV